MEFTIDLIAKTTDDGGLAQSFADQLAQFEGCTAVLKTEGEVFRVESSEGNFFELHRTYLVTIPEPTV